MFPEDDGTDFFRQAGKDKQRKKGDGDDFIRAAVLFFGRQQQQIKNIGQRHKQKADDGGEQEDSRSFCHGDERIVDLRQIDQRLVCKNGKFRYTAENEKWQ